MKKNGSVVQKNKVSHNLDMRLLCSSLVAVGLVFYACFLLPYDPLALGSFLMKHLGCTGFILLPMTVYLVWMMTLTLFWPEMRYSDLYAHLNKVSRLGPIFGILGTFIALGVGLPMLGKDGFSLVAILKMAVCVGTGIWSSVLGVALGAIAEEMTRIDEGRGLEMEELEEFQGTAPMYEPRTVTSNE